MSYETILVLSIKMGVKNSHLFVNAFCIFEFVYIFLIFVSSVSLKNVLISVGEVSNLLHKQITMCQTLFLITK